MIRFPTKPRANDETVLDMLALRDSGLPVAKIAIRLGVTKGTVSGALFRVDRDYAKSEVAA